MVEATKGLQISRPRMEKSKQELADAHCHIENISQQVLADSVNYGVKIIVANGVDLASNIKTLAMSDGINIFAAVGVHPEYAAGITDEELERNIRLARDNRKAIVAIGEIGIDMHFVKRPEDLTKQKLVFSRFVDLALELGLPVCIHSRGALEDIFSILEQKGARKVQLHFFEGDVEQAAIAVKRGYMISVPPMESSKRRRVIRSVPISSLLAETDSPVNGAVPKDVEKSISIIAGAKGIGFEAAAEALTQNTRRFFNIGMSNLMR